MPVIGLAAGLAKENAWRAGVRAEAVAARQWDDLVALAAFVDPCSAWFRHYSCLLASDLNFLHLRD